jgi:hypothetical protein
LASPLGLLTTAYEGDGVGMPVGRGVPVGDAELVGGGDAELDGVAVGVGVGVGVAFGVGVVAGRDVVGAGVGEAEDRTVEVPPVVPEVGGLTPQ